MRRLSRPRIVRQGGQTCDSDWEQSCDSDYYLYLFSTIAGAMFCFCCFTCTVRYCVQRSTRRAQGSGYGRLSGGPAPGAARRGDGAGANGALDAAVTEAAAGRGGANTAEGEAVRRAMQITKLREKLREDEVSQFFCVL